MPRQRKRNVKKNVQSKSIEKKPSVTRSKASNNTMDDTQKLEPTGTIGMRTRSTDTQIDHQDEISKPPITDRMIMDHDIIDIDHSPVHHDKYTEPSQLALQEELHEELTEELNSSPIRKIHSSPRRSVAFSDDITSDGPKYDIRPLPHQITPKKSILKTNNGDGKLDKLTDEGLDEATFHPELPSYWSHGTIIQLPPYSQLIYPLINGCIQVLQDKSFNLRFEVYATLNHNIKVNYPQYILKVLTNNKPPTNQQISPLKNSLKSPLKNPLWKPPSKNPGRFIHGDFVSQLSSLIQRDMINIESKESISEKDQCEKENQPSKVKTNPFSNRIIGQGLKIMLQFISDDKMCEHLSVEDIRWFYYHSASMIVKPNISKSLAVQYLNIIKAFPFPPKRTRLIFENPTGVDVPEQILFGIINMKYFPSASLNLEKALALNQLLTNFPNTFINNFNNWFPIFMIQLFQLNNPVYSKAFMIAIVTLTESARLFLNNYEISIMVNDFLNTNLTPELINEFDMKQNDKNFDLLLKTLENLILNDKAKHAMDIWCSISILVCDKRRGFEKWDKLNRWLNIWKLTLSNNSPEMAIEAWRAIIYNLCINDLDNLKTYNIDYSQLNDDGSIQIPIILLDKFNLLITVFENHFNYSSFQVLQSIENLVLKLFYCLINRETARESQNLNIYWYYLIRPMFALIFTRCDVPELHISMHTFFQNLIFKLLKSPSPNLTEKPFNSTKCLSIDELSFTDIKPLDPKWCYLNNDKLIDVAYWFHSDKVLLSNKSLFISSICDIIKINLENSNNYQFKNKIVDRIFTAWCGIFKDHTIDQTNCYDIVCMFSIIFNCFGFNALNDDSGIQRFVSRLIEIACKFNSKQMNETLGKLFNAIDKSKLFPLLYKLYTSESFLSKFDSQLLDNLLELCKINVSSEVDLHNIGELFSTYDGNFNSFGKLVIQRLVLLKEDEFIKSIKLIGLSYWKLPIFKFYILLIQSSPFKFMINNITELIKFRINYDRPSTLDICNLLIDQNLNHLLNNLSLPILDNYSKLEGYLQFEFKKSWLKYLFKLKNQEDWEILDNILVKSNEAGIEIENSLLHDILNKLPNYNKTQSENVPRQVSNEGVTDQKERISEALKSKSVQNVANNNVEQDNEHPKDKLVNNAEDSRPSMLLVSTQQINQSLPQSTSVNESITIIDNLSDVDSDLPDNTFSLDTGNDSDNDDSFMISEKSFDNPPMKKRSLEPEQQSIDKRSKRDTSPETHHNYDQEIQVASSLPLTDELEHVHLNSNVPLLNDSPTRKVNSVVESINSPLSNSQNNPSFPQVEATATPINKIDQITQMVDQINDNDLNVEPGKINNLETKLLSFLLQLKTRNSPPVNS